MASLSASMHEHPSHAEDGPLCCFMQGWTCTQVFEGHSHYVMQVVFNPKDTNTFASASLDRTVKVNLNSPQPSKHLNAVYSQSV